MEESSRCWTRGSRLKGSKSSNFMVESWDGNNLKTLVSEILFNLLFKRRNWDKGRNYVLSLKTNHL